MSWPEVLLVALAGTCITVGVLVRAHDALIWFSELVARAVVPDRIPLGPERRAPRRRRAR